MNNKNIFIFGAGYVGISLACILSTKHKVTLYDINKQKIELINSKKSPIKDSLIESYITENGLNAVTDIYKIIDADFIIIATPTNYDETTNQFDCSIVERCIESSMRMNEKATIVIKSTIPIGFTDSMRDIYHTDRILFSPEFLREGKALYDNLHPSRIIVSQGDNSEEFATMLLECAEEDFISVGIVGSKEAEAIKLFSNTYLAMRVAFFNELDSFAMRNDLNAFELIKGVCTDKRIGLGYNNPSFGYGGYCLPKDTKQLRYHCKDILNSNIINSIIKSNDTRKDTIVDAITSKVDKNCIIGIYKISMKSGSDNSRNSATLDIVYKLIEAGYKVIVYDPNINIIDGISLCKDLNEFKRNSSIIIANRKDKNLDDVKDKVFSRDVFGEN